MTDSSGLVPGDIVNLSELRAHLFPADMFLLSGDAIVNESMLTGESVPVSKNSAKDEDIARWRELKDVQGDLAKSFVYAGTRVVRIRGALGLDGSIGRPALGLVVRTGNFCVSASSLIILTSLERVQHDQRRPCSVDVVSKADGIQVLPRLDPLHHCTRWDGWFGLLRECHSVCQAWGDASSSDFFSSSDLCTQVRWDTIIVRALDLVTVVVPPALPATLSIGTSFAIGRLRKLGIFCISPTRVNVGGKVNVCCFDKTGTLTEDGLDILGVRSLDRLEQRFGELIDNVHDLPTTRDRASFLHALATCHSLKMIEGDVLGDPLDVKMFEFTKWTLEEGLISGTGIIKERGGAERPAALVQTVVRPPGSVQFRFEDAFKTNGRVCPLMWLLGTTLIADVASMRISWSWVSSGHLNSCRPCDG